MHTTDNIVNAGDVVEFTIRGERRTAIVLLVTQGGEALLDLVDDDRPAWARLTDIEHLTVFNPGVDVADTLLSPAA